MGADRDAMQDVELDLPDGTDHDADPDAARQERVARVRRLGRRWWPVPVLLVLALVASRLVIDARERERIEQRQTVAGVLRDVDRDLTAVPLDDQDDSGVLLSSGDLRITLLGTDESTGRTLRATRDDQVLWTTALDPAGSTVPVGGFDTPWCFAADDPLTQVVCLVTEHENTAEADGSWMAGPQTGARLVRLDAATGAETARVELPRYSSADLLDGVLYLASVADDGGTLTISAQDPATGADRWRTEQPLGGTSTAADTAAGLGIDTSGGRLLVRTSTGSWLLDPDDGSVRYHGDEPLRVSRTGLVDLSGDGALFLADDGTVRATGSGTTALLSVDDGSVPDLELLTESTGNAGNATALVAVDVRAGGEAWRADLAGWSGASVILLDGVLYGAGDLQAWAVDAATGERLWTVDLASGSDGTLLTDGEYLFTAAWADQDSVTIAVGIDPVTGWTSTSTTATGYDLLAYRLTDGSLAWRTALPTGIIMISSTGHDLIGYDSAGDAYRLR